MKVALVLFFVSFSCFGKINEIYNLWADNDLTAKTYAQSRIKVVGNFSPDYFLIPIMDSYHKRIFYTALVNKKGHIRETFANETKFKSNAYPISRFVDKHTIGFLYPNGFTLRTIKGKTLISYKQKRFRFHHDFHYDPVSKNLIVLVELKKKLFWKTGKVEKVKFTALARINLQTKKTTFIWKQTDSLDMMHSLKKAKGSELDWGHINAFIYDKENSFLWLCARDLNKIFKVNLKNNKVIFTYNDNNIAGPHSIHLDEKRNELVFLDNQKDTALMSRLVRINLKTNKTEMYSFQTKANTRGSVKILGNGNYLVFLPDLNSAGQGYLNEVSGDFKQIVAQMSLITRGNGGFMVDAISGEIL